MKQADFIKQKQSQWHDFAEQLKQDDIPRELPKLVRQLNHDLSIAKSRQYSPAIVDYLNQLLLQAQQQLYTPNKRLWQPFANFWVSTFPEHLQLLRQPVLLAHALFYGCVLVAFILVLLMPESIRNVISNAQVVELEYMYDPTSSHYGKERDSDSDVFMFGYYIMNNISIAFQCFVGGLLLGIGSLYFLLFNAVFFGAISAHIVNIDFQQTFFSFVITHGAFELEAIVLSAAAGIHIGWRLIRPGQVSRKFALQQSARQSFPIILGCFLLLLLAAFIEAFWSSSQVVPVWVKYMLGSGCWLLVLSYIFAGKKHAAG